MKINEVLLKEIDVKVEKFKTKNMVVELDGRKYQWTGQSWIDVTNAIKNSDGKLQGAKKAPQEIQDRLNAGFPEEPKNNQDPQQDPKLVNKFKKPGKPPIPAGVIASRLLGAGDESTYPDLLQKGRGQYAKIFPDAGLLNIKGTNAEGMTYKGIEVDKVLVPVHFVNNDQIIKNNHMFYVLDGRIEQFRKIDKNDKHFYQHWAFVTRHILIY